MHGSAMATTDTFLLWLLMLSAITVLLFGWRCHRAGVFAIFGRKATTARALCRLALAAAMPALLISGWFMLNPSVPDWAWLGTAHLAVVWYVLRGLLPDDLTTAAVVTST